MDKSPARSYGRFDITVGDRKLFFKTQAGVFSQNGVDEGTMLLLDVVLPVLKPHQTVLDLGTGVGIVGVAIAGSLSRGDVWMVDSDVRAVRLAEQNLRLNGVENAHVVLGDITLDLPRMRFDLVISNPPTHSGKEVLASFVDESHHVLRPGGSLYLVVNRLLSVRDMMAAIFGEAEQVERRKGFVVLHAKKPRLRARESSSQSQESA
jgi:16S rRNA (guanine1207-N2)-methyltransferase